MGHVYDKTVRNFSTKGKCPLLVPCVIPIAPPCFAEWGDQTLRSPFPQQKLLSSENLPQK